MPPRRRGRGRGQFQESEGQNEDLRSVPLRGRGRRVEDEVEDMTARVDNMEIVMASGSRAEFCGFYGVKHPSTQCVGVQGSCNIYDRYGYFTRVCPLAGSQQAAAPPQGRGGSSRGRSPQFSILGMERCSLGRSSCLVRRVSDSLLSRFSSGPQHAQAKAITREQAEGAPSGVIAGGGRLRQSGPRPEARLLRHPTLEGLTRSSRMDSPRQLGRNKFRRGGGVHRRRRREVGGGRRRLAH
ncbi:hypothetical protein F511_31311 [Dorcoceras hygrometricum]|uniref:Uncharacterized protein n=1 Tax=Dorcoceras hygrometricum TaxID=472368 RepID=A0A2Z7AF50_9LAMI|nr:hypothetical protein F511_31311 [Dorcoceras hygrometricum]